MPDLTSGDIPYIPDRDSYTTGGFAVVEIDRPVHVVFDTLTAVSNWPEINKGVTISIQPPDVDAVPGAKFKETIQAPVEGMDRWTNEWEVMEVDPGRKFVIVALDHFASVPIPSQLTYTFEPISESRTRFRRSIETAPSAEFWDKVKPHEKEALFRFQGSQVEMAAHLKKYVEENTKA